MNDLPQNLPLIAQLAPGLTLRGSEQSGFFIVGPVPASEVGLCMGDPRPVAPAPRLPVSEFQAGYLLALDQPRTQNRARDAAFLAELVCGNTLSDEQINRVERGLPWREPPSDHGRLA